MDKPGRVQRKYKGIVKGVKKQRPTGEGYKLAF